MNVKKDKYEIIIVGSGLGGLVAGTLLAREKRSVILLREKGYQPHFSRDRYQFIPFSNFSERCLNPSLVKRLVQRLDLTPGREFEGRDENVPGRSAKGKAHVSFQVLLPKARIDLSPERSFLEREWKREFRSEVPRLEKFYDELGALVNRWKDKEEKDPFFPVKFPSPFEALFPLFSSSKRSGDRMLSSFSQEFRMFVRLQLISRGNFCFDRFPASLAAYLMMGGEQDPCGPSVNSNELEHMILRKFSESGGLIEEIEGVDKVDGGSRKDVSVSLKEDRKPFQSQFLIFNSPIHALKHLRGEGGNPLAKWRQRIQPKYILLPCFIGIREKAVPVGMKDLLVSVIDLDKPPEKGNLILMTLSPKEDETQAPEGRRALIVGSLLPYEEFDAVRSRNAFVDHQRAVINHLSHIIPFLEDHIEFIDFDWTKDQTLCWSYPHFLYEIRFQNRWRHGVVPTRLSRRVYFSGKENFPYLGLEGEILAGLIVGTQISALNKRRDRSLSSGPLG